MLKEKFRFAPVLAVGISIGASSVALNTRNEIYDHAIASAEDAFENSPGVEEMRSANLLIEYQNEFGQTVYRYNPPPTPKIDSTVTAASEDVGDSIYLMPMMKEFTNASAAYESVYFRTKSEPVTALGIKLNYNQADHLGKLAFAAGIIFAMATVVNENSLSQTYNNKGARSSRT